jgi:hypothetical protein
LVVSNFSANIKELQKGKMYNGINFTEVSLD